MRKNLFGRIGYAITKDYCGIINLDTWPARNIAEDLWPLRGYSCFEVMEAKKTVVFHLKDHLNRLDYSMKQLNLPAPPKIGKLSIDLKNFLGRAIKEVLIANKLSSSLVRIYATGGYTYDGFHPSTTPNIFIFIQPHPVMKFKKGQELRLKTLVYSRDFPEIKTTNYCAAETVNPYFTSQSFDDVLYAHHNAILETSMANFFLVDYWGLKTIIRTAQNNVLHGVTRGVILNLAAEMGYVAETGEISTYDIHSASEAFVTSTTRGVWPVKKVKIADYPTRIFLENKIALELRKAFLKYRQDYYNKVDRK